MLTVCVCSLSTVFFVCLSVDAHLLFWLRAALTAWQSLQWHFHVLLMPGAVLTELSKGSKTKALRHSSPGCFPQTCAFYSQASCNCVMSSLCVQYGCPEIYCSFMRSSCRPRSHCQRYIDMLYVRLDSPITHCVPKHMNKYGVGVGWHFTSCAVCVCVCSFGEPSI